MCAHSNCTKRMQYQVGLKVNTVEVVQARALPGRMCRCDFTSELSQAVLLPSLGLWLTSESI